jgi:hypothetical protein
MVDGWIGLTKSRSNPASSARRPSCDGPRPVIAMSYIPFPE